MGLSVEIRQRIYGYVVPPPNSGSMTTIVSVMSPEDEDECSNTVKGPTLAALSRTNWEIHKEVAAILYRNVVFEVSTWRQLSEDELARFKHAQYIKVNHYDVARSENEYLDDFEEIIEHLEASTALQWLKCHLEMPTRQARQYVEWMMDSDDSDNSDDDGRDDDLDYAHESDAVSMRISDAIGEESGTLPDLDKTRGLQDAREQLRWSHSFVWGNEF